MNCSDAKDLIQLYLDEELSARDTLEVQRHLESCTSCTTLFDYFARQDDILKQFARSEARDNNQLRERILQAVSGEKQKPASLRRSGFLRGGFLTSPALRRIAAVFIIAIIAAFFLLRGSTPFINDKVYAAAVRDHAHHCSLEMMNALKGTVSDPNELDRFIANYSRLKTVPDLSQFGYGNPLARLCGLNGFIVCHVVYQKEGGNPLSIFLKLHDARMIADELVSTTRGEYHISSLSQNGTDVLIVAPSEENQTPTIAKAVAAQMQK